MPRTRRSATRTSGSSSGSGSSTSSSPPTTASWAARAPRSSCTRPPSARTPSCARPAATPRTSRRSRRSRPSRSRSTGCPTPVIFDSPNTPTIADARRPLQRAPRGSRRRHRRPRDRRATEWTAAHTLKNVVLALTHLDGTRELVIVGLPGDRDVDDKRVEVAFAPAAVEAATEQDFERNPLLVKGYIGPWSETGAMLGEESATGIRYPARPARRRRHRLDHRRQHRPEARAHARRRSRLRRRRLRRGRERARGRPRARRLRARSSSPAAWRSATSSSSAASSPRRSGLKVLDENGKLVTVTMGSYGIGVTRILAIIAELNNDDKGLIWPEVGRAVRRPRDRDGSGCRRLRSRRRSCRPSSRPPASTCSTTTARQGLARREVRRRRADRRAEDRHRGPRRPRRPGRAVGPPHGRPRGRPGGRRGRALTGVDRRRRRAQARSAG